MKKLFTRFFLAILILLSISSSSQAQQDCCGAGSLMSVLFNSGVYGGYGIQKFNANGLNHYIDVYNKKRTSTLTQKMDSFEQVKGFRVGANVFQFLVDDILLGMKVSYQWMKEKNEARANLTAGGTARREYELTLKQFGIGMSVAYYANKYIDIKIADLFLTWNSADLVNRLVELNNATEQKLTSTENPIGFNVAAGLTFYPLPPYIALEATVGYAFFSIDKMQFEDGSLLQVDEDTSEAMTNFIDTGGIYAFIQLNLVIPFD